MGGGAELLWQVAHIDWWMQWTVGGKDGGGGSRTHER